MARAESQVTEVLGILGMNLTCLLHFSNDENIIYLFNCLTLSVLTKCPIWVKHSTKHFNPHHLIQSSQQPYVVVLLSSPL